MNYYKQIAEMLDIELDEVFKIQSETSVYENNKEYKLTEDGLMWRFTDAPWRNVETTWLEDIFHGDAKIVKIPWKPKYGEQYWSYSLKINRTCCNMFGDFIEDYAMWKSGNCFRTEEEAKTKGKEIMEKLVKEYEEA